jgi:hypothetical protein
MSTELKRAVKRQTKRSVVVPAAQLNDLREQLVNAGECGPIERVSLPVANITSLRGILLDFDPALFRKEVLPRKGGTNPGTFFEQVIRPILQRHPLFEKGEVRCSGRGLHAILRFGAPIHFVEEADRQRWAAIVRIVHRTLPTDPDCPGLTALTRPIGSINSKSKSDVTLLQQGKPVAAEEVIGLCEAVRKSPFRTIASILFGDSPLATCPVCRKPSTRLDPLDQNGVCYGGCGRVRLGQLFDVFLQPRQPQAK